LAEILTVLLGVVLIGLASYVLFRAVAGRSSLPPAADSGTVGSSEAHVTLPVDDVDPEHPPVRRLATDTAHRVLARDPAVTRVVVLSRSGRELARIDRAAVAPRLVDVPTALLEPHAPRHPGPREPALADEPVHGPGNVGFAERRPEPRRSLAEHFELAEDTRGRIRDAEDPVDVVRAIFESSGLPFDMDGNLLRRGGRCVIVAHTPIHTPVDAETLNAAFMRFERTGAGRGVFVTAGVLHASDVHRREVLAPALHHVGPSGIQRMADAVAVGADPLDLVLPE
jgi:hypothetical protein